MSQTENPATYSGAAAEAVRSLNRATLRGGYTAPGDVCIVVSDLQTLGRRLVQAIDQAQDALERMAAAESIYDDRNHLDSPLKIDPDVTVTTIGNELAAAQMHIHRYAQALQSAAEHLSHLGGR